MFLALGYATPIQSRATAPIAVILTIPQGASVQGNPSYEPDPLTINAGDTIMVENEDSTPHTVTNGRDATDPNMGKLFDTSIINAGDSGEIVTTDLNPGEYPFFCAVHPYQTGTLVVQDGDSEQTSGQSPLDESTERQKETASPDLVREFLSDAIDGVQNNNTERALVFMDFVRQQMLPQSNISSTFRLILSLVDDAAEALQKGDSDTALSDLNIANERIIPLTNYTENTLSDNATTAVIETNQEGNVSIAQDNGILRIREGEDLKPIGNNNTRTYENSQLGIKIKYPKSWKVFSEQTGNECFDGINWCVVSFAPNSTTELGYGDSQLEIARTSFEEDPFNPCSNCESLIDSVRYYYQKELKSIDENPGFDDYQFISDNQTMLAGNNSAWQIEYKHSFNDSFDNKTYDVQNLKLITKSNGSDYIFDYRAPAGKDFMKYLPDIKSMFNSIEFISTANKTAERAPSFILSEQDNGSTPSSAEGGSPFSMETDTAIQANNLTGSSDDKIIPSSLSNMYPLIVDNSTFPMKYQINGGTIDNITTNRDQPSLFVNISSQSNGTIAIVLPRSLIDSKAQGNVDEEYTVFSDGQITWANETASDNQSRTLVTDFENGVEEIEIQGTEILGVDTNNNTQPILQIDSIQAINNTRESEVEQSLEETKQEIEQLQQQENNKEIQTDSPIPSLVEVTNQTTFTSPNLDNKVQPTITKGDILQFANNGTSFDGYFKQQLSTMNTTGKLALEAAIEKISSNQSALTTGANACMSPLGQIFGGFICDYGLSLVYELCQAFPNLNQLIVCASPTIANHLAERNIPDGQTDRLAWLFFSLDNNELTANPLSSRDDQVAADTLPSSAESGLSVITENFFEDSFGYLHVVGEVRNDLNVPMNFVRVNVAFYDSQNKIVGTDFTYTEPSTISSGSTATYEVMTSKDSLGSSDVNSIKTSFEWQ